MEKYFLMKGYEEASKEELFSELRNRKLEQNKKHIFFIRFILQRMPHVLLLSYFTIFPIMFHQNVCHIMKDFCMFVFRSNMHIKYI